MNTATAPSRAQQFYGKTPLLHAPTQFPSPGPGGRPLPAGEAQSAIPSAKNPQSAILAKLLGMAACSCRECANLQGPQGLERRFWTGGIRGTARCSGFFATDILDDMHYCVFSRAVVYGQYGREVTA